MNSRGRWWVTAWLAGLGSGLLAAPFAALDADAGTDGAATLCNNGTPVDLFSYLGGTPDLGGTWTGPGGGAHAAIFDPATDTPGAYVYTVTGPPDASATVTVTVVDAPDAGSDGSLTVCSNGAPVDLFSRLGGSPDAGGTWTFGGSPVSGTFTPGTSPAGTYTYTVAGTPPCADDAATVNVTVIAPPNAGTNGSITVCSNAVPLSLFTQLGGTPDGSGAWTFGGSPVSSTFTPGTSAPGVYTYTVNGTPPCASAQATVTVAVVAAPDAGVSRSITVCSDGAPFSMRGRLNGTPQAGGAWTIGGNPHADTFTPGTDAGGVYTYTVTGTPPCTNATATLTITVREAPDAGMAGTLTVCSTDANFSLFAQLGGTPDAGGTWTGPDGIHPDQFQPGVDQPGVYTYTVTGQSPCDPSTATVTVTVNPAPNAGTSTSVVKCSNEPVFSLFAQLGGTPQSGGTWTGPDGPATANFDPASSTPGLYTYTVNGLPPCAPAVATVNVTVIQAPDAGTNGTHTVCSTGASFSLFSRLGGTPDAGGTWTFGGSPVSNTFVPGTSPAGVYTYTVAGTAPCANATATVTVTVVQAANAGTNGSVTLCSNSPNEDLFTHLGGTPQAGGAWTRPGGGALAGGIYQPSNPMHPAGVYTYTVNGTAPCPNVSATVQVVENQAPRAGVDGTVTVCSNGPAFSMVSSLGGSPDAGGTWRNAANATVPGTFTPGTTPAGVYRYVVPGLAPCANDTAQLAVAVNQAPNAGTGGSTTVCSDDAPFGLITVLGGTPDAGGSWRDPNNQPFGGTFTPGPGALQGGYTYTVPGLSPCANATSVVVVNQHRRPVAGDDAAIQLCSTDASVDLFNSLGGTPDAGGTWTAPGGGPSSGIFIPGTSPAGAYKYKLVGTAPCANDSAIVTVTVVQAPNAGTNGQLTVCNDQGQVDLFDVLGGTPDLTGTWNDDDATGQLSSNFFTPLGLPPGDYDFTYTVPGNAQCAAATATARVTIVPDLEAGTSGTLNVCSSQTAVDLFTGLGGSPQPGGTWIDLDNTGHVSGHFFNAGGPTGTGPYHFRYRLTGTLACSSDSATVTVNVTRAPDAGGDGTANFCSNGPQVSLFPYLTGTPQSGGQWRRLPGSTVVSGNYNPMFDNPGTYSYTVSGTPPCANDVSLVVVTETLQPNAGNSAVTTVCANGPSFNMTSRLGGSPSPSGTWAGPDNTPHGATFVPGLDAPGVYLYSVSATFPCTNGIASLTINVNEPPFAGNDASTTVCSNAPPFSLLDLLGGAQPGGSWRDPHGDPYPNSGIYTPGVSEPGTYTYKRNGQFPCGFDEATVTVFEVEEADAGLSTSVALCSGSGTVSLVSLLGGTPDLTGSWVGPAPANPPVPSGNFTPGISAPGVYTYTVPGVPPCANATATVTIAVNPEANAGTSTNITVCSSQQQFQLITRLGGGPAANGTWTYPPGSTEPPTGIFTPGVSLPGVYTYTVGGTAPCPAATSTVTVAVNQAPNAGTSGSLQLCSTSGATPLFPSLGGTPQAGGSWTRVTGNVPHSGIFQPATDAPGAYRYMVTGVAPCPNASAVVTVSVNRAPHAGSNGLRIVCDDEPPFSLFTVLQDDPDVGGVWRDSEGNTLFGIYSPATDDPDVFTYTVAGATPCANSSAQVTIIENHAPNAGTDAVVSVCSDQAPFDLLDRLNGTPDGNGEWYDPNMDPFSGTFVPSTGVGGEYTYVVHGLAPCTDAVSHVTVILNRSPNAGVSTAPLICSNTPAMPLLDLLGGMPDQTGSWSGPTPGPIYDPASGVSGTYTYTVPGSTPCTDASAIVQITLVPAPNAGTDGALSACASESNVVLFPGLNGSPQVGGTWADTDGTGRLTNGVFDAAGMTPGVYRFTYTVEGTAPCGDASAMVSVTVTDALNAGEDASVELCKSQGSVDLLLHLGGAPQPGGTWTGVESNAGLTNGVLDPPAAGVGTHHYRYVLTGSADCEGDTAILTVTILEGPNAGDNSSITTCSTSGDIDLFNSLGNPHDLNGMWYYPDWTELDPSGSSIVHPASDPSGGYHYVVPAIGNCGADTAMVNVQITTAPDAGGDGTLAFCSNGAGQNLGLGLTGTPDPNGTWTFGGNPHGPVYVPVNDVPGVYTYTVLGQSPCANDNAVVVVSEHTAPFAGLDNTYTICSSAGAFNMFTQLAGNPQSGGSWRGPTMAAHGSSYNPAVDSSGIYTYIISGAAPCVNDTALLTVVEIPAASAGRDSLMDVCSTVAEIDLFAALGPEADSVGTWQDVDNSGALTDSLFSPSLAGAGTYHFIYTVEGTGLCPDVSATVTVNVGGTLNAGIGGSDMVCGGITAYDLFQSLDGTPDPGGVWEDGLGGAVIDGSILDPTSLPPGATYPFSYTLTDPVCGEVSSVVDLFIAPYPDPGTDSTVVVCANAPAFSLFDMLGGTPQPGGTWTAPSGAPTDGSFDPATYSPGPYTYRRTGIAPCSDSTATVTVVVNQPANAGDPGLLLACDTGAVELFPALGGTPQQGGHWVDVSGTDALTGGTVDADGLAPGIYRFRYVMDVEGCKSDSAEVSLTVVDGVTVSDVQRICNDTLRTYTVSFTISGGDPSSYSVSGTEGTLSASAPYVFTSAPFFTSQPFTIIVDDAYHCSPQMVEGGTPCDFADDVFVPESFTPNGDGVNDLFIIPGIEGFPENTIAVFNRWGAEIYSAAGYDNEKVVWDGSSPNALIPGDATTGTYYYVLELGAGRDAIKGFVYLNR